MECVNCYNGEVEQTEPEIFRCNYCDTSYKVEYECHVCGEYVEAGKIHYHAGITQIYCSKDCSAEA